MSFREKSAWISLLSIVIPFGFYFAALGQSMHSHAGGSHHGGVHLFGVFVACVLLQIAIQVVLHIAATVQAPKDARLAKDERERLIELKATRIAFFVLMVGVLLVAASLHVGAGGFLMCNGILLSLVLAETVKYSGQIVYFRRGV